MTEQVEQTIATHDVTISFNQQIRFRAHPKNQQGEPATIDGPLSCGVLSGDGTFSIDSMDPLGVVLIPGAAPGDTMYKISGDSNLGGGLVRISEQVLLHVVPAEATTLNLVADPPMFR